MMHGLPNGKSKESASRVGLPARAIFQSEAER